MISQYWINQIPARPLSIQVKTESGEDANLSGYTDIEVVMLGSNNEEIDLTGSVLDTAGKPVGSLLFKWPTTKSLFKYPGDYVLQIKLSGTGRLDFTSTHTIRVRELGRTR